MRPCSRKEKKDFPEPSGWGPVVTITWSIMLRVLLCFVPLSLLPFDLPPKNVVLCAGVTGTAVAVFKVVVAMHDLFRGG
jgi:hypothetical protein